MFDEKKQKPFRFQSPPREGVLRQRQASDGKTMVHEIAAFIGEAIASKRGDALNRALMRVSRPAARAFYN